MNNLQSCIAFVAPQAKFLTIYGFEIQFLTDFRWFLNPKPNISEKKLRNPKIRKKIKDPDPTADRRGGGGSPISGFLNFIAPMVYLWKRCTM